MNISRAFKMPFSGEGWVKTVLIGFGITAASMFANNIEHVGWLLNTLLGALTLGYCVRVMRNETRATETTVPASLPQWTEWKDLFTDGLVLTAVNMIYGIAFAIVAGVLTLALGMTGMVSAALAGDASVHLSGGLALIWIASLAVMGVLFALYSAMMMAHYAHQDRFAAAFEVVTIAKKLFGSFGNALRAIFAMLLLIALVVVSAFTIVGLPLGVFLAQVIGSTIWGQVYRASKN